MITPAELQELKSQLRSMVVEDVPATLAALKDALPSEAPRTGEVLTLEGQYQELKKETLRQTISVENQQLIGNQIRSKLVDLIAALELDDFLPGQRKVEPTPRRQRGLYLGLVLLLGMLLALVLYLMRGEETADWFPLPANRSGHLLYQVPAQMALQQETPCLVRIAFDSSEVVRDLSLADVKVEEIRTSNKMKVELVDSQAEPVFRIRNILGDDEQFIEQGDYTEWQFGVTPLVPGTHKLLLKVTILKKIDGEYVPKNLSFSKEVEILADEPVRVEATFENSGQVIAENSAAALVQTIEEEREQYAAIKEAFRTGNADWGSLLAGWNKGMDISFPEVEAELSPLIVYFPYNSAAPISDADVGVLFQSLATGITLSDAKLELVGHTDDRGSVGYNLNLGQERAAVISAMLVRLGVEAARIIIRSEGESMPVATNATEEGRAQNRRVEIRLLLE